MFTPLLIKKNLLRKYFVQMSLFSKKQMVECYKWCRLYETPRFFIELPRKRVIFSCIHNMCFPRTTIQMSTPRTHFFSRFACFAANIIRNKGLVLYIYIYVCIILRITYSIYFICLRILIPYYFERLYTRRTSFERFITSGNEDFGI